MGLMDKLKKQAGKVKDIFMDEPFEDEPIKTEMIQVEIASPKIEQIKEELVEDKALLAEAAKTDKYKAPVYFDDADFDIIGKNKEKTYTPKQVLNKTVSEEKKYFKPSPIISPVYGILDKNYRKEDITTKKKTPSRQQAERIVKPSTFEEIRKKAFGTLEDELENNMFKSNLKEDKIEKIDFQDDMFDEIDFHLEEDFIPKSDEQLSMDFDFSENLVKTELNKKNQATINVLNESKLSDDKLFDLIDMMHEKEEN